MKIGFTVGVYDLPHKGHINLFKNAKKLCDYLIVGVVSDKAVKAQKGDNRPIMTQENRMDVVSEFKSVNEVIALSSFNPYQELVKRKKFNNSVLSSQEIDMFIKGADQDHIEHSYATEFGIPLVILPRTPDVSTSGTIRRVTRDSNK